MKAKPTTTPAEQEADQLVRALLGTPGMLQELKYRLHQTQQQGPPRHVMSADERAELGLQVRERAKTISEVSGKQAERKEKFEARQKAALEALAREWEEICDGDPDGWGHNIWRSEVEAQLWDGRVPLVDELISRVEGEISNLKADAFTIPGDGLDQTREGVILTDEYLAHSILHRHPRHLTNLASVEARQTALRQLVESVRNWTKRGEYRDEQELQARFDAGYAAVPSVEGIKAVVARDERGRTWMAKMSRLLPGRAPAPAA